MWTTIAIFIASMTTIGWFIARTQKTFVFVLFVLTNLFVGGYALNYYNTFLGYPYPNYSGEIVMLKKEKRGDMIYVWGYTPENVEVPRAYSFPFNYDKTDQKGSFKFDRFGNLVDDKDKVVSEYSKVLRYEPKMDQNFGSMYIDVYTPQSDPLKDRIQR